MTSESHLEETEKVPKIGEKVTVKTWPGHWVHRRKAVVSDGPFWEVRLHNGDVFYAATDEITEAH